MTVASQVKHAILEMKGVQGTLRLYTTSRTPKRDVVRAIRVGGAKKSYVTLHMTFSYFNGMIYMAF